MTRSVPASLSLVAAVAIGFLVAALLQLPQGPAPRTVRLIAYSLAGAVAVLALIKAFDGAAPASVLVDVLKALAWPAVVAVFLALYRTPLSALLDRVNSVEGEAGPVKFSIGARIAEAATDLVEASRQKVETGLEAGARIADAVPAAPIPTAAQVKTQLVASVSDADAAACAGKRILWVDDNPEGNRNEQRALTRFGIIVGIARYTAAAMDRLGDENYDLVITDLNRDGNSNEGIRMIEMMRAQGLRVPVVIYTARRAAVRRMKDAQGKGVLITGDPVELIEFVVRLLAHPDSAK